MSKKLTVTLFFMLMMLTAAVAFAQEHGGTGEETKLVNPEYVPYFVAVVMAAAFSIGIGTIGTGIAMGNAVRGAVDGVSRNPDTFGRILTTMMIGLAMIESLAIYALIVALVLLFANPFQGSFGIILGG